MGKPVQLNNFHMNGHTLNSLHMQTENAGTVFSGQISMAIERLFKLAFI